MKDTRQQNSTSHPILLRMVSSTDHVTAVTGATVTVTAAKDGAVSYSATSGAVTELGDGLYWWAGNATDRNTLGSMAIKATATGADDYLTSVTIVPSDPFNGANFALTALPSGTPANPTHALLTSGTGTGEIATDGSGNVSLTATQNPVLHTGTATAATSLSITLDAGASTVTSAYAARTISIISGTGSGQSRCVIQYIGSTSKIATVDRAWDVTPDATSVFVIFIWITPKLDIGARANLGMWLDTAPKSLSNQYVQADVETILGTTSAGAPGFVGIDWAQVHAPTTSVSLSGTTISSTQAVASVTGNVTVGAFAIGAITSAAFASGAITATVAPNLDAAVSSRSTYAGADTPGTTTLLTRLTAARSGYLDNLNVGGNVASHADIVAINTSSSKHLLLVTVGQYEPGETYTIEMRTFAAADGSAVNADTTPTLTATGNVSGSLAANLSAATNPATGVYRWTYTPGTAPTLEQIRFDGSAVISASTFTLSCYAQTVDQATVVWTTTDQSHLTAIFNNQTTILGQVNKIGTNSGDSAELVTGLTTIATNLDAKVSGRMASGNVVVGGYAASQDPGTYVLATAANKLTTDAAGRVTLAPTGLDPIAITDPGIVANQNTFPKRMIAVWRSIFGPSKLTATQLQYLADDGVTANATCAVNDNGVTQTKGAAS